MVEIKVMDKEIPIEYFQEEEMLFEEHVQERLDNDEINGFEAAFMLGYGAS